MARTLRWGSLTLLVAGLRVTKRDTENEDSKPCVSLQPAVLSALSRRESMQSIPHPHHRLIWSPTRTPSLQELHHVWVPLLARSLAPWQSCWCAKLPFCFKTSTTPRDRGLVGATSCHGKGASEGGWELCDATIRIIESASVCMWLVVGQGQLFANASRCFSYLVPIFLPPFGSSRVCPTLNPSSQSNQQFG